MRFLKVCAIATWARELHGNYTGAVTKLLFNRERSGWSSLLAAYEEEHEVREPSCAHMYLSYCM